jgi:hypothetical protein
MVNGEYCEIILSYYYSSLFICSQVSQGCSEEMFFFLFLQDKSRTMARQAGNHFIEGTLDDLTFYKMDGVYYVRMKSSLTRKKVLKSPRFALTRMHAGQLGEASRIASVIYKGIPREERNIRLFRSIVGKAKVMLGKGKEKEVVLESLCFEYRTRNKEQGISNEEVMFNVQLSMLNIQVERKVKGETIVRGEKGVERSGLLLVNERGRLVEVVYCYSVFLNDMVLDPSASLREGRDDNLGREKMRCRSFAELRMTEND